MQDNKLRILLFGTWKFGQIHQNKQYNISAGQSVMHTLSYWLQNESIYLIKQYHTKQSSILYLHEQIKSTTIYLIHDNLPYSCTTSQ